MKHLKKIWEPIKVFLKSRRNVLALITGFVGLSAAIGSKYGIAVDVETFTATLATAYVLAYGQGKYEKEIIITDTGKDAKWSEGPFVVALVGCLMPFILLVGDVFGFDIPANLPAQLTAGAAVIVGVWLKLKVAAAGAKNTNA